MKFTEVRSSMQTFSGASTADYQLAYLSEETRRLLLSLGNMYVDYLTRDITGAEALPVDLKAWLGGQYYNKSNEHAKDCIEHCARVHHIFGRRIKGWTEGALKCYDNFLLKYIQTDQNATIPKSGKHLKETDVYHYLISRGGAEQTIGQHFLSIYQMRNAFQHVHIEEKDGTRTTRMPSNAQFNRDRDLIIQWFGEALGLLMQALGGR
jgi:hypothetical protein